MQYQLADLYEGLCDANPTAEVLCAGAACRTREQLDQRANRFAHHLLSVGVKAGDRVGVYAYNRVEWVEILLACWKIRASVVNINYRYVTQELRYMWQNAGMSALVYEKSFAAEVNALRMDFAIQHYVWLDDETDAPAPTDLQYEDVLAARSPERGFPQRSGDDQLLIYTGGTTGMPKGVLWRHFDLYHNVVRGNAESERPESILACAKQDTPRRVLTLSPLMHGGGQFNVIWTVFNGGVACIPVSRRFDPSEVLETLVRRSVSVLGIIGDAMARPLAEALLASPREIPSLKVISSGGALLTEPARQLLKQAFGDKVILTGGIGGSELGTAATEAGQGLSTQGPRFKPTSALAVLDAALHVIQPGSRGEGSLAMRGFIPLGYHNDPDKTAQVWRTDSAGVRWVLAGDRARVEDDGTFTLLGRDALCINSGGEKIYVEEVERAVALHAAVRLCAVVGMPDPKWQQRVVAVVELQPAAELSLKELQDHCRNHIAGYKVPRELVLSELRRTPNGKIDYAWARHCARTHA